MNAPPPTTTGFKRQIVFRNGFEDWPLLEAAANEHGSIQAAILAGLRALPTTKTPRANHQCPEGRHTGQACRETQQEHVSRPGR